MKLLIEKTIKILHTILGFLKPKIVLLLLLIIIFPFILFLETSYTYWSRGYQGSFLEKPTQTPISIGAWKRKPNLPGDTPQYIIDALDKLPDTSKDAVTGIISDMVNDPAVIDDNKDKGIYIVDELSDLFGPDGKILSPLKPGNVIIYTVIENGKEKVIVLPVTDYFSQEIDHLEDLLSVIESKWGGINTLSPEWNSKNQYSLFTAPVQYNGKSYLPLNGGTTDSSPADLNTWFELSEDLSYVPSNIYPSQVTGYIVKHGTNSSGEPGYYLATGYVSASTAPDPNASYSPWKPIPSAKAGTNYPIGTVVWTNDGGKVHFWRALQATTSLPSETEARNGVWQEFANGWIATGKLSSPYFAHNTYKTGETVIDGISVLFNYRYYKAIADVPADQAPLIDDGYGGKKLNTQYWVEVK